jgi:hypothetical protein
MIKNQGKVPNSISLLNMLNENFITLNSTSTL